MRQLKPARRGVRGFTGSAALGAAWSMWSTTDFHRKSTVRGEADGWVHGSRKEVPPYYTENNYSST